MKTFEEVLKQEPIYLHDWAEGKKIALISDFENIYMTKEEYEAEEAPYINKQFWEEKKVIMAEKIKEYESVNILFASYGCANYSGDAFVLFEKEGKLFEVMGLERQFDPEETTIEALAFRLSEGTLGKDDYSDNEFAEELKQFLGI